MHRLWDGCLHLETYPRDRFVRDDGEASWQEQRWGWCIERGGEPSEAHTPELNDSFQSRGQDGKPKSLQLKPMCAHLARRRSFDGISGAHRRPPFHLV